MHQGQATERDVNSASARVGFDDLNETVSGFMQVLFPAVGGWNFFYTPEEGDQVVTERLPNGKEEGYILGKVYTGNRMPQKGKPNVFKMVSKDGKNLFEFDANEGTLNLTVDQDGKIKFKNVEFEVYETTDWVTKFLNILATEHACLTTKELDVESDNPMGFQGTKTQLGSGALIVLYKALLVALRKNPILIPPAPIPPGMPVFPTPIFINMFLFRLINDFIAALEQAIANTEKVLK